MSGEIPYDEHSQYIKIEAYNISWKLLDKLIQDEKIKGYPCTNGNVTTFYLSKSIYPTHCLLHCDRLRFEEKIIAKCCVSKISDFIVKCSEDVSFKYDSSHSVFNVKKDAGFILPLTLMQRYKPDKNCIVTHEIWNENYKEIHLSKILITDHYGNIFYYEGNSSNCFKQLF